MKEDTVKNSSTGGAPGARPPRSPRMGLSVRSWIIWLAVILVFNVVFYGPLFNHTTSTPTTTLSYSTFLTQAKAGNIATARISSTTADGDFRRPYKAPGSNTAYRHYTVTLLPIADPSLVGLLTAQHVQLTGTISVEPLWVSVLSLLLTA